MKYGLVIGEFCRTPWAILEEKLVEITAFLELAASGLKLSAEEIAAITQKRERDTAEARGDVAVLPMVGIISQRGGNMAETSGPMGVSTQRLASQFRVVMDDPSIKAVILDVDSPGGQVSGVEELSAEIFASRGKKPVVAVANYLAASAAYWIASAADEFVVAPGAMVGSIGVFAAHMDRSQLQEKLGVKTTLISAGKFKTEGNPFEPLTLEGRDGIQKLVDQQYGAFVGSVARNRGVAQKEVRGGFGEGRLVCAADAVEIGMADRIATLRETIQRFAGGAMVSSRHAAMPVKRMARALRFQEIT